MIATNKPNTGYVPGQPQTLSDASALVALHSWAQTGTLKEPKGKGYQLVADSYAYLLKRLGISEFNDSVPAAKGVDIELLSERFHEVYQIEAHRRGDVRHADAYDELSEATKEWDRVLVRYVLANFTPKFNGEPPMPEGSNLHWHGDDFSHEHPHPERWDSRHQESL